MKHARVEDELDIFEELRGMAFKGKNKGILCQLNEMDLIWNDDYSDWSDHDSLDNLFNDSSDEE